VIIQELELANFRRFVRLQMDFHPELTVIVARNGQGKTSVLDGITVALGTFVGAFDMGKAQHIEKADARRARLGEQPEGEAQYPVTVQALFGRPEMQVRRELSGPKNKTTIRDAHAITDYGVQLQTMVRTLAQEPLPLVSYYGAGRLWKAHKNMERKQVVSASRTVGYEDCLSPASNFVQCQQWMAKATFADWDEQRRPPEQRLAVSMGERLAVIQDAVNLVLAEEGWSDFRYSPEHEELTMFHPETGRLPVSYLSDGVRAMVSMVADIAFRCVRLNGFMGREAARSTQGLVLIDEVDMHLHPAWQQRVIGSLQRAFPLVQFIVTTHSPQVLSTVGREHIRILRETEAGGHEAVMPDFSPLAHEAGDALAKVMGTHPHAPLPLRETVQQFELMVRAGHEQTEEAQALKGELDVAGYQIHDSDLSLWRLLARRKAQS
jgi:predicted ATP-binding protein involved in virulence